MKQKIMNKRLTQFSIKHGLNYGKPNLKNPIIIFMFMRVHYFYSQ